jgi:hypothetical protein
MQTTSDGSMPKSEFCRENFLILNIVLDEAAGVAGAAFTLNYPSSVLEAPETNANGIPVNAGDIQSLFPFSFQGTDTHRENSSEAGKIYFSGAAIDTASGGALYDSGERDLFSIRFKVKTDAPLGDCVLSLSQTELFNIAAGYGTDNNSNGVYDEGVDQKDKVPVLIGAVDNQHADWGDLTKAFPILLGDDGNPFTTVSQGITISPVANYTISGTISYSGLQVGRLLVCAIDYPFNNPTAFTFSVAPGTYSILAFIDTNGNAIQDAWEPGGSYSSQVTVGPDATGIDFSLSDGNLNLDTDGDGLPDWWEVKYSTTNLDRAKSDTDDNGTPDGNEDPDLDGYSNLAEYQGNSDPSDLADIPDTSYTTIQLNLKAGWNLISLPLTPSDPSLSILIPEAIVAYKFNGAYQQATTLEPGNGYWVKVPADGIYDITGQKFSGYTASLSPGWHLMGAVYSANAVIPATSLSDSISVMYEFNNSYQQATNFTQCKGYWVKITQSCDFMVDCQ